MNVEDIMAELSSDDNGDKDDKDDSNAEEHDV